MKSIYIFIFIFVFSVFARAQDQYTEYAEGRLLFLMDNLKNPSKSDSSDQVKINASELAWFIISITEDNLYSEKLAKMINNVEDIYGLLPILDGIHFLNDRGGLRGKQWQSNLAMNSSPNLIFEITRRARVIYVDKGFYFPTYTGKIYGKL